MRTLISIILLLGTAACANAQVILLQDEIRDGKFILRVKNNLPCPSVVTASPVSVDKKFQQFLPQESERILIELPSDSVENPHNFHRQMRYNLVLGDPNAIPDPKYRYLLPYPRGKSHRLIQGNNSDFTHNDADSRYAFDFEMEEGSIVTAIRGGVVGFVKDNNNQSGTNKEFLEKGNQILICHDDGTVAIYAHLKKEGAFVDIGDNIFAGQAIGLSGNTGFSTTPHLHLVVMAGTKSIPIQFRNLPDSLIQGVSYKNDS